MTDRPDVFWIVLVTIIALAFLYGLTRQRAPAGDRAPQKKPGKFPSETEWCLRRENWSAYVERRDQVEVRLKDGSRVDFLSKRYAIEVDWSHKWHEGIGQALYYGFTTGRDPGLVLLVKEPMTETDRQHVRRANYTAAKVGISVWIERVRPD